MKNFIFICLFLRYACAAGQLDNFQSDEERLKNSFLAHLNFENVPQFSNEEFNNFQVPAHMKMRYQLLTWKKQAKFEMEALGRQRRSTLPSLAGLFNQVHKNSSKNFVQHFFMHVVFQKFCCFPDQYNVAYIFFQTAEGLFFVFINRK